jgi:hypothetical protein
MSASSPRLSKEGTGIGGSTTLAELPLGHYSPVNFSRLRSLSISKSLNRRRAFSPDGQITGASSGSPRRVFDGGLAYTFTNASPHWTEKCCASVGVSSLLRWPSESPQQQPPFRIWQPPVLRWGRFWVATQHREPFPPRPTIFNDRMTDSPHSP